MLRWLADRSAIRDTLVRFCEAADTDHERLGDHYTADAHEDHGFFKGDVSDLVKIIPNVLAQYELSTTLVANSRADIHGDAADVESYVIGWHRTRPVDGERRDILSHVRYRDRMVRRGDRWLVQQRTVVWEWSRTTPREAA